MNKQVQEASGMKRGAMLASLLIGAFITFLNENLLTNTFPGLMREFNVTTSTYNGYRPVIC
ncbi:hypothetical protein [Paenibacillus anseongensis]|uniref:hypothetical protein n=1 Tax=Paenibacillus TaxID=44249 RepID=UPI001FEBEF65|nr:MULTISPECIES: hypothetical protein [Paenibacillus]